MIKSINNRDFVFLLCNKADQPIGSLYTSSLQWQIIKKIAYVFPRIFLGYDDDGKDIYAGIQRELSPDRKEQITQYIKDPNATFPTAILINIPLEKVLIVPMSFNSTINFTQFNEDSVDKDFLNIIAGDAQEVITNFIWLIFPYREGIAQIIDGQHRMSGFETADDSLVFDLPVTFFLNQDVSEQAEMFAIINGKQTRVTPSLVYELFGISPTRSPYTVASKVVKLLNESNESPLKHSIKILGKSNMLYNGFITQSTVAKIIIDLISGNAKQAEEDKRLLRRKMSVSDLPTLTKRKAVLRRYFIAEKDEVIFKVILNFFNAVKSIFPDEWLKPDSVLKKTIGFAALAQVMANLIEEGLITGDLSEEYFKNKLHPFIETKFENIQLSSKGVKQLVNLIS